MRAATVVVETRCIQKSWAPWVEEQRDAVTSLNEQRGQNLNIYCEVITIAKLKTCAPCVSSEADVPVDASMVSSRDDKYHFNASAAKQ